ncbi:hypothetical protein F4774DRAFT_428105 [Daldinia eschscholtzii]|nr:hypothetical protein F4774DRAFT_428105 [Daldinia eschscholtzii]
MSSGTTESIVPTGRADLRDRFNRQVAPSSGSGTVVGGYQTPYATNSPPGPPPPYSPPPAYTYLPGHPRGVPPPWHYYSNMGSNRQPYPGPYPGYISHHRTHPGWPHPAAPSIAPTMPSNTPPPNPFRPAGMPSYPHNPGHADTNPFIHLAHHSSRSAFSNYMAGQRAGHQHAAGHPHATSYQQVPGQRQGTNHQHTDPTSREEADLNERPEHTYFWTERDLFHWMSRIYRPLAGVVGRIVQEELHLHEQPKVKFEMYPVRVDEYTGAPSMVPQSMSRGPMYQITLPAPGGTTADLEKARDALKDEFGVQPNAWHRLAGFVFRISRRDRAGACASAKRSWVPPQCVYRFSRTQRCYVAQRVVPALDDIRELDNTFDHGDDSDDDQEALVSEMWSDVRSRSWFAQNQDQDQDQGSGYM